MTDAVVASDLTSDFVTIAGPPPSARARPALAPTAPASTDHVAHLTIPCGNDARAVMLQLATRVFFQEATRTAASFVAPLNRSGSSMPIFWIPSVTGSGAEAIGLARALGPEQPFHCLRVPHKMRTGAYGRSIDAMAGDYARAIREAHDAGPVIIGAWSAGAVVGYAMMPYLRALGIAVDRFVVIDYAIYLSPSRNPFSIRLSARSMVGLRDTLRSSPSLFAFARRLLDKLGEAAKAIAVADGAGSGKPHPMTELTERKRLKSDERDFVEGLHDAADAYRPRRPCDVPVLLFVAKDNKVAPRHPRIQQILRAIQAIWGKEARWRRIAPVLTAVYYEGDHDTLLDAPQVIATDLRRELTVRPSRHPGPDLPVQKAASGMMSLQEAEPAV